MSGFLRALRAVRPESGLNVPTGARWLPVGEGARLWLLLDLRAIRGSAMRGLHRSMQSRAPLPTAERRGKTSSRPPPWQRRVHERKSIQASSSGKR